MADFVVLSLLSNTLFAGGLALLTLLFARICRNPHLTHALWLLVLIKLVTPPLVEVPIAKPVAVAQDSALLLFQPTEDRSVSETRPGLGRGTLLSSNFSNEREVTSPRRAFSGTPNWTALLLGSWFVGTTLFIGIALQRNARFSQLLGESQPARAALIDDANDIAMKMGLAACPAIRTTTACISPLVSGIWRKKVILLPQSILDELSRDQTRTVLAHEIAHIRRRDHLVQLLRFSVLAVQWWNPLAWWASRQLEKAQEECCDAWVVWTLPNHRRTYGKTLFQMVEFLTEPRLLPVVSKTFMSQCNLERRIEMVLKQAVPRTITRRLAGVALITGLLALPTAFTFASAPEATKQSPQPGAEATAEADVSSSDLPHTVKFEQGETRFLEGDEITITDVRGTSKAFEPGHIYRIQGTYKLASRDKASLAAYTTASKASDGRSQPLKVQHMSVNRGEGEFVLFLPMSYQGWPHVSFYPHDGGNGFGGNYFGTGDYVLTKWWGESEEKPPSNSQVIKLDKLLWTDAPELRQRFGERVVGSLRFGIVARVEGYDGDWEALKAQQAMSGSNFQLQANDHATLPARMHSGGITFGSGEAWVLFDVQGRPTPGVAYTLRAPDSSWVATSPTSKR